jgi:hypothetical protein
VDVAEKSYFFGMLESLRNRFHETVDLRGIQPVSLTAPLTRPELNRFCTSDSPVSFFGLRRDVSRARHLCVPHPARRDRSEPSTSPCRSRVATAPACHGRRRDVRLATRNWRCSSCESDEAAAAGRLAAAPR